MSNLNGDVRVQRAGMRAADLEFKTANEALEIKKANAFEVTQNAEMVEREKKGDRKFRSAKSRKALTNILSHDFSGEKWILQKKGKRDSKKNINSAYKKLTGKTGFFGGLSRADKAARQAEFETRRIRSAEASRAIAELASENDLGENMDEKEMISQISAIDIGKYNLESDASFVEKFSEYMKELQKAEMLLDYFRSEEGNELMGKHEELSMKLLWMNSIKEAYMERITVISSPYYVSIRDEDLTDSTVRNMERQLERSKSAKPGEKGVLSKADQDIYRAYLKYHRRKNNRIGKTYYFKFDKEQAYPEIRLKSELYENAYTNKKIQKGMNDEANREESGKAVDKFFSSDQFGMFKEHWLVQNNTPGWMGDYEDDKVSKEDFKKNVQHMKDKIDELRGAEKGYNKRQLDETGKALDNILSKVDSGEIEMDVARMWLDRTIGQFRLAGWLGEDIRIHRQKDKDFEKLSEDKKDPVVKQGIEELGSLVYKYSEELGTRGYVSIRHAKDDKVRYKRFVHEKNYEKCKSFAQLKRLDHENLSPDLEKTCKELGKGIGGSIHIRGGRFRSDQAETSYKVTISANPKHKKESVEELLEYAKERHLLNYMYISIRTGVDGPCSDDLTVRFSTDLTLENVKEFLDGYSKRCADKNPKILADDDSMMPATTVKYKDGISMSPEVPHDMMQFIKEQTEELKAYNSESRMNTETGMNATKRMKAKEMPEHMNYDSFIYEQMILSYYLAYRRLINMPNVLGSGTRKAKPDSDNGLLRAEAKKVFRQLMILNGIDPETMTSLKIRDEVEAEKKREKKVSLSETLDELEKKYKKA